MQTDLRPPSLRTCVGCRGRGPRSDLLRVVAVEGALVPDPSRRLGGRGAHVHPDAACLTLAERRRAWPRALRVTGTLDATRLVAHLAQEHDRPAASVRPVDENGKQDDPIR